MMTSATLHCHLSGRQMLVAWQLEQKLATFPLFESVGLNKLCWMKRSNIEGIWMKSHDLLYFATALSMERNDYTAGGGENCKFSMENFWIATFSTSEWVFTEFTISKTFSSTHTAFISFSDSIVQWHKQKKIQPQDMH